MSGGRSLRDFDPVVYRVAFSEAFFMRKTSSRSRLPRTPTLRRHKPSSLGVVTLNGQDIYLGRWPAGQKKPPIAVQAEYDRRVSEWLANGRRLRQEIPQQGADSPSVSDLMLAFALHVELHYRREDGTHTSEVREFKAALRPLREMYGTMAASAFGPLKLKAVRQKFIEAGLSRGVINQRIGRVVRMFKWAVSEELIPETVWRALTTVRGLEKGRTVAHESEPVKPVAEAHVAATLPFMLPQIRALVELQLVTGMRPGEVCAMRACDIDMTGDVWLYRPATHKTKHRGKERVVALGPKAQDVVRVFLKPDTQAFLFSARDAMEYRRSQLRLKRKSRVPPSQQHRRKRKPRKQPGKQYQTSSYAHAIAKAVLAANTAAACDKCKKLKPAERCEACKKAAIPHWHPHQLRHTHATEVRRRFGLEAAQVALGHSQAQITEVYAERDLALAAKVAREVG
jgi:integrase